MTKYKAIFLRNEKEWAIKKRKFGFWFFIHEPSGAWWDKPPLKSYGSLVLALQQISQFEETDAMLYAEAARRFRRENLLVDYCDPLVGRIVKYDKFKSWK